ncbi:hypothetical protein HMPREF9104_01751 [Lentilactobacillus kisonensis F0435]|uniref:Uncharacterized protein n=1 Tax=Lentilactobacillus kisonensis F0435 TaxID=797516 RepID=H1LGM7_9LACO|nr:hypothetical protein HMPREF9104_01751 [Lentilactobacillus kisonensis F0435]
MTVLSQTNHLQNYIFLLEKYTMPQNISSDLFSFLNHFFRK